MSRVFHVFGLGYGDEGKGTIVDALVRKHDAAAVVRYNGGPQAAHHVVEHDRFHCCSQFGSGILAPGVRTHLSQGMLVKPQNLIAEAERLASIGVPDALARLTLSPDCYLVTPWHAMVGQMLEASRGSSGYGSVGMGVGRAALDRTRSPESALRVRDLLEHSELLDKLHQHYAESLVEANSILDQGGEAEVRAIFDSFMERSTPAFLHQEYLKLTGILEGSIVEDAVVLRGLADQGAVVLEGAQGVLLDPSVGFAPYVTKTPVTPAAAREVLGLLGAEESVLHVGVTRSFATRHGAGPLVTEADIPRLAMGEHNGTNRWQGSFRYGWLDLVALRYSVAMAGTVGSLAVTCLDRHVGQEEVRSCISYEYLGEVDEAFDSSFVWDVTASGQVRVTGIKNPVDLTEESRLLRTKMLFACRPLEFIVLPGWTCEDVSHPDGVHRNLRAFLEFIESSAGLETPVRIAACGAAAASKYFLLDT